VLAVGAFLFKEPHIAKQLTANVLGLITRIRPFALLLFALLNSPAPTASSNPDVRGVKAETLLAIVLAPSMRHVQMEAAP